MLKPLLTLSISLAAIFTTLLNTNSSGEIKPPVASPGTYPIIHYNIVFAPDLSNRLNSKLYPRPLTDVEIFQTITENLYPTILRYRRSENQKDKLSIDFINKRLINQYNVNTEKLHIDFGQFKRQNDRIAYILGRNGVKKTLATDVQAMLSEYKRVNDIASVNNFGADIWTYLNEGVDEKLSLSAEAPIRFDGTTYINQYRNVLIIPTDGYIEAGIYNKGYDLSKVTIDKFRSAFKKSGESDITSFFNKHKEFRIKPVHNQYLKNVEILVLELYDRSLTRGGAATVHPTDMEIIKLLWSDWLNNSKVKRFELHPTMNTKDEASKVVLHFLNVK